MQNLDVPHETLITRFIFNFCALNKSMSVTNELSVTRWEVKCYTSGIQVQYKSLSCNTNVTMFNTNSSLFWYHFTRP